MDPLAEAFTAPVVMALAGSRSYQRGAAYYHDGRVAASVGTDLRLKVTVQGTMPYAVELWVDGGEPRWSCTCPAAEDGSFCKHCVAVALSLDPSEPAVAPFGSARDRTPAPAADHELADFVERLPQDRLAAIVLEQAASNWRLRERLLAEARAGRGDGPDLGAWRHRIEDAFASYDGFVAYREAEGWAMVVEEVIDALEDLCDAGRPEAAALLAEHALRRADQAVGYVDDSDGWLSVVSERLFEVHHRACSEGRPDPAELARGLVELELNSELGGFRRAAAVYGEILGEVGLAAYREHLESHRKRIDVDATRDADDREIDSFVVQEAMVGWALATGDPDALIEVHSRAGGPTHPGEVLEIARSLEAAGRVDEAIRWAESGLAEHANRFWQTLDLRGYLAERLRERGEASAAVALFWVAFTSDPSLVAYRRLLEEARREPDVADGWSQRGVAELRARVAGQEADGEASERRIGSQTAAVLVDILLYEGRIDEAWSAAIAFGCAREMWMTLARAREQAHPLDAIAVYETEVLSLINRKKTPAYKSAVDLMNRIRRLAGTAEEPYRFSGLLERVRTEHRAKRNLKKLLDDKGW